MIGAGTDIDNDLTPAAEIPYELETENTMIPSMEKALEVVQILHQIFTSDQIYSLDGFAAIIAAAAGRYPLESIEFAPFAIEVNLTPAIGFLLIQKTPKRDDDIFVDILQPNQENQLISRQALLKRYGFKSLSPMTRLTAISQLVKNSIALLENRKLQKQDLHKKLKLLRDVISSHSDDLETLYLTDPVLTHIPHTSIRIALSQIDGILTRES